jgi:hypothetical protein
VTLLPNFDFCFPVSRARLLGFLYPNCKAQIPQLLTSECRFLYSALGFLAIERVYQKSYYPNCKAKDFEALEFCFLNSVFLPSELSIKTRKSRTADLPDSATPELLNTASSPICAQNHLITNRPGVGNHASFQDRVCQIQPKPLGISVPEMFDERCHII